VRVLSRFLIREMRRYLRDSVIDELIGVKAYELRKAYRRVNGRPVEHFIGVAFSSAALIPQSRSLLREARANRGNKPNWIDCYNPAKDHYLQTPERVRIQTWSATHAQTRRNIMKLADTPDAAQLAVIFLLERGLNRSNISPRQLAKLASREEAIIVIVCEVRDFLEQFLQPLETGLWLRTKSSDNSEDSNHTRPARSAVPMWEIIRFPQPETDPAAQTVLAMSTGAPTLVIAATLDRVPHLLRMSSDSVWECGRLDSETVQKVVQTVTGSEIAELDEATDLSTLNLAELALIIKPRRKPEQIGMRLSRAISNRKSSQARVNNDNVVDFISYRARRKF